MVFTPFHTTENSHTMLLHLILAAIVASRPFALSADVRFCPITSCDPYGGAPLPVFFPFRLTTVLDPGDYPRTPMYCDYQGFDLSCSNRSETVLTLPGSGPFSVRSIDYFNRSLLLNDPDSCLPKRLLNFSLAGSPFRPEIEVNYTLLNCSSDEAASSAQASMPRSRMIPCMSGGPLGYKVMSVLTRLYNGSGHTCGLVGNIRVPVAWTYTYDLTEDVKLMWDWQDCRRCVNLDMDFCELINGCDRIARSSGLPRSAKYGIIIGIGIPGLLFIIGIASYAVSWIRAFHARGNSIDTSPALRRAITPPPPFITGLNGRTIESYPKTTLGASRRLPKASDNTCPICLSEYEAKDTLRTIPECNHYFHADCIDEWLKMNGTCPLCRNSLE